MDGLSDRAKAYLDAFAERYPAPAVVPPRRASVTSRTMRRLGWIAPLVGIAAVAVVSWSATRTTATEMVDAKSFDAAPHRAEPRATQKTIAPTSPVVRRDRDRVVVAPQPEPPRRVVTPVRAPKPSASPSPSPSTLRRELALLDVAKSSLRAGDRDGARRALSQHAERFPNGLLAPERARLTKRVDDQTDASACVHSSCVGSDEHQESTR